MAGAHSNSHLANLMTSNKIIKGCDPLLIIGQEFHNVHVIITALFGHNNLLEDLLQAKDVWLLALSNKLLQLANKAICTDFQ